MSSDGGSPRPGRPLPSSGPGRKVGPYEVLRELGRGGMGVVLEVRHPDLPRRLALKLILQQDEQTLARFLREAQLLARVTHPNIVKVHTLDRAPEGLYLVTDLVEGQELFECCRHGPLEPREAARIVRELAGAVSALHAQGVLHRDLKPQNVIVRPNGTPILLDFGIAREMDSRERLTLTGALLGTPAYMAPEQAVGASPATLTAAVDVYGLGAILFNLLAARAPFEDEAGAVQLVSIVSQEPVWPSATRAGVPRDLEAILRVAMAKAPGARYPTAAALRADLDAWLRGERPWAAGVAPARRGRAALLVTGAVAVGLSAALLVLSFVLASIDLRPNGALEPPSRPPPTATQAPLPPPPGTDDAQGGARARPRDVPERLLFESSRKAPAWTGACALDLPGALVVAWRFPEPGERARDGSSASQVALFDLSRPPGDPVLRFVWPFPTEVRAGGALAGGRFVIVGYGGELAEYHASSPAPRRARFARGLGLKALACSPDGAHVALGGHRDEVLVLDPASPSPPLRLPGHGVCDWVGGVAFSPDGTLLAVTGHTAFASGRDAYLWVWSTADGRLRGRARLLFGSMSVGFSGDGRQLLVGIVNGLVQRFETATLAELETRFAARETQTIGAGTELLAHSAHVMAVLADPDALMLTASGGFNKDDWDEPRWNEVRAWRLPPGPGDVQEVFLGPDTAPVRRGPRPYLGLALTRDGRFLLAPTAAGQVEVWAR